jgi:hypothetical protein
VLVASPIAWCSDAAWRSGVSRRSEGLSAARRRGSSAQLLMAKMVCSRSEAASLARWPSVFVKTKI